MMATGWAVTFDHLSGGLVAGFDVPVDALTSVGCHGRLCRQHI
jgi:hypothetical protein